MSIRGREMLRISAIAVLSACLLGALIYYLPFEGGAPRSAFGFVWATGENSPTESEYNVCLRRMFFVIKFYFENGTYVTLPSAYLSGGDEWYHLPPEMEYHGEIDASSLAAIGARFLYYGVKRPGDAIATMKGFENRFLNVYLISGEVTTEMGTHKYPHEDITIWFNQTHSMEGGVTNVTNTKNTGYFVERYCTNVPTWNITLDELSQILPHTGTATLEFHASEEMNLHYNITIDDDTKIGDANVTWDGILGTYQLNCDHGRILSVKYDFMSAFLFLKIEK